MDKNQRLHDIAVRVQSAVAPLLRVGNRPGNDAGHDSMIAQCIADAVMALANDMVNGEDG